jgi:hypothetical protein
MGPKVEFHQGEKLSREEDRAFRSADVHMGRLEARLLDLSERLPDFNGDPEIVSVKGRPHIFDPALDLRIKVDAVRWMLRVAKHVQDPARERILLTVTNSLAQLERAVNERPHAA